MSTAKLAIIVDSLDSPPLIVGRVRDHYLLMEGFRSAIKDAENRERSLDPFESHAGRQHSIVLKHLLSEVISTELP